MSGPAPITLVELNAVAALQTRRDRKYIVANERLHDMLNALGSQHRVLEIDGRQRFGYESVYFDTADLQLFRAAATGRRHRFKVRTRTYMDSGLCMLEVKTKEGRGQTAKHRCEYAVGNRSRLTATAEKFISEASTGAQQKLDRVLTTTYERSTFVHLETATRLTVDYNLVCTDSAGRSVTLDAAVVETKSSHAPSPVDHWLWATGQRPVKISKFCTGLVALHPTLPSNKWHRALQYGWTERPLDGAA